MPLVESHRNRRHGALPPNVLGLFSPTTLPLSFMPMPVATQPGGAPRSCAFPLELQINASQHPPDGLVEVPTTSPRSFSPNPALPLRKLFVLPPRSMSPVLAFHRIACWFGPHVEHNPLPDTCPWALMPQGNMFGPISVTV